MKLPCTNPCRSKLASHRLSFGSVFLPRSAFTCSGLAKMILRLPSKMLNTGFQYEPVLSMTASVHPLSSSHVRSRSNSFTLVPNRRTSPTGFWFASPIRMQTAKNFFPTSIPAHFSTLTSSMAPPSRRETDAFMFTLSRGLDSTNRRFVLRRPDHFPNGVVSTIYKAAILLSSAILSSSGVARRAMRLSYIRQRNVERLYLLLQPFDPPRSRFALAGRAKFYKSATRNPYYLLLFAPHQRGGLC